MDDMIVETGPNYGKITFNRPKSRNSLTHDMMMGIISAIAEFEQNPAVRAVILTGSGDAFCSGGDMDLLMKITKMKPAEIKTEVYGGAQGCVRAVKLCKKPTIAAVHGPAAGAGCELAVACDFRIVTPQALFYESWVNLGIIAPLGGMFLLPQLVGLGKATEMLMLGKKVGGEEAERIGLATQVVAKDALEAETMAMVDQLAAGPPLAYPVFKEGLRRSAESSLAAEWEAAVYAQAMLLDTEDFGEAVAAFKEKRRPVFQGK